MHTWFVAIWDNLGIIFVPFVAWDRGPNPDLVHASLHHFCSVDLIIWNEGMSSILGGILSLRIRSTTYRIRYTFLRKRFIKKSQFLLYIAIGSISFQLFNGIRSTNLKIINYLLVAGIWTHLIFEYYSAHPLFWWKKSARKRIF